MSSPRNTRSESPGKPGEGSTSRFAFGPFEFDAHTGLLVGDGVEHSLSPRPAAVLGLLLRDPGRLVTKTTFLDRVWEGLAVNEHALADTISALRQVLGDDAREPTYIQTLHRRGYRFVATVRSSSVARGNEEGVPSPVARPGSRRRLGSTALVLAAGILGVAAMARSFALAGSTSSGEPLAAASGEAGSSMGPSTARSAPGPEWVYVDDPFGTGQPAYADGQWLPDDTLRVTVGGGDDQTIVGMSGAWSLSFGVATPRRLVLSFRYNLTLQPDYESDEYTEAVVTLDGVRLGDRFPGAIDRLTGNGNGGKTQTTGWRKVTLDLGSVPPGRHTLLFGAFGNKKTYRNEAAEVRYADFRIADAEGSGE